MMKGDSMISIITPVYNEEENINCFYDAVTAVMKQVGMDYELIYVNDGSRDGTEKEISRLAVADPHVRARYRSWVMNRQAM